MQLWILIFLGVLIWYSVDQDTQLVFLIVLHLTESNLSEFRSRCPTQRSKRRPQRIHKKDWLANKDGGWCSIRFAKRVQSCWKCSNCTVGGDQSRCRAELSQKLRAWNQSILQHTRVAQVVAAWLRENWERMKKWRGNVAKSTKKN